MNYVVKLNIKGVYGRARHPQSQGQVNDSTKQLREDQLSP